MIVFNLCIRPRLIRKTIINNIMKKFELLDLFTLTLKKQKVPSYGDAHEKEYPQRIPMVLIGMCFANSSLKLAIPLVLEEVYTRMSGLEVKQQDYVWLMAVVIISIALSQAVLIAYGLVLALYRLNVRREVSSRIIGNNFSDYQARLEAPVLGESEAEGSMQLWVKANTRLSVYLHNYYESYLSLAFECLNIVAILLYLFYKLKWSLFFGLAIAGMVMYKTITTAGIMTNVRFNNIALRAKRLKLLEGFFTRVSEFKMSWLDRWIYDRVTKIQGQFQSGLREIKLLDCWCVALWQFTGVGISSIVIIAYFLLGLNETVDPQSVFTPSTFIYLLGMLNYPLNALSWYIAGIRTAQRAIQQLEKDVRLPSDRSSKYTKIQQEEGNLIIKEEIELGFGPSAQRHNKHQHKIILPVKELKHQVIYSVAGDYAQEFLQKLVFLIDQKAVKGYVQENAWLCPSSLESICMQADFTAISKQKQQQICQLMQLFDCSDIPLHTNTMNYSGGEKLRVSLVRAFHLGQVIVINSNLNSLDKAMKAKVQDSIKRLVCHSSKQYTIFIKQNEEISDQVITFELQKNNTYRLAFQETKKEEIMHTSLTNIPISTQISQFMTNALVQLQRTTQEQEERQASIKVDQIDHNEKVQQKSNVSFQTLRIYYKSPKHIWFLLSMLVVTFLSNYYNYYVNSYINLSKYEQNQVVIIVGITLVFAVGLYFRSYLFADANLDEASRICHDLNRNILMQQLSFYHSQEQLRDSPEDTASKSQLICVLSSDTETIADHFPFSTNIFANNVTVVVSSIVVILLEVPQMFVLVLLLIYYSHSLNKVSHHKDEALKMALKQKEVQLYNSVSLLESARKYLILHNRLSHFTAHYEKLREQHMALDWLSQRYRGYINLKYKAMMILFLLVAVGVYSIVNVFGSPSGSSSSGLALLIQYTIQLSNYLLYFTMSIWEIKGQAVSIERVKPYLKHKQSVQSRVAAADKVIRKLHQKYNKKQQQLNKPLIDIRSLNYAYESNAGTPIFKQLNLQVLPGEKIIIKGRSGSGKTTLYKLLTSAYPSVLNLVEQPFHISFSPQHPLLLPDAATLQENLNPYKIEGKWEQIDAQMAKHELGEVKSLQQLTYEQKIVINNLRAYLHGRGGVTIYDEPQVVIGNEDQTYLIVTHHHDFPHNRQLHLSDGQLLPLS